MNTDTLNGRENDCSSWIPPGATELLAGWPPVSLELTHMSIPPPYSTFNSMLPVYSCPDLRTIQPSSLEISLSPAAHLPVSIRSLHMTPTTSAPTPRRTLTDEDRRRICLYHEENKSARQADIGAVFGVERSTVSKILRQKEKYLSMDEENRPRIKRRQQKVPDIAKALENWARKYEDPGFVVSPALIEEKKRLFAMACADPDGKRNPVSAGWLKKFKQQTDSAGLNARKEFSNTIASDVESITHHQSPTVTVPSTIDESFVSPIELVSSYLSPSLSQGNTYKRIGDHDLLHFSRDSAQHGSSQSTLVTTPSTDIDSTRSLQLSERVYASAARSRPPLISSAGCGSRSQAFSPAMNTEIPNGNGEHCSSMISNRSEHGSFSDVMVDSHSDGDLQQSSQVDIYDNSSHNSMNHPGCNLSLESVGNPMHSSFVAPSWPNEHLHSAPCPRIDHKLCSESTFWTRATEGGLRDNEEIERET